LILNGVFVCGMMGRFILYNEGTREA